MAEYFDLLEVRTTDLREKDMMQDLQKQVAFAQKNSNAFENILKNINPQEIKTRQALAQLPITRKTDLLELQKKGRTNNKKDIFGGFSSVILGKKMPRVFASPGPIYEPEGLPSDYWRMARALFAAGFRSDELIHNCFSYHFVPAGSMLETGAHALGCTVFPGGTGQTEQQVQAMAELNPAGYVGTPSFLKIILEKAKEMGVELPSVNKALFSGEAFPPSLRDWFRGSGVRGYQCYASADLGLIAYETEAREGLVVDEQVLLEIVRPGTGDVVPDGEVGEVVVTNFNPTYPLIRFGTGDLSAVMVGACPTGRTNMRIKGWMGRADQTTKIRGMFVHAAQVAEVSKRFPEVLKARLVVTGEMARDDMTLYVETISDLQDDLPNKISEAVRDITKLRGTVVRVETGYLANDGKVIEDARNYK